MNNKTMKKYVQFGSGSEAVEGWLNFDASPTLFIQRIPLIGRLLRSNLNCTFDHNVLYGCIVKGLPLEENSLDGLFCSHILEHLSYSDFSIALKNSFKYIKPGVGVFRIIVPDLEYYIDRYQKQLTSRNYDDKARAAIDFCQDTYLGITESRIGLRVRINELFSNKAHRWMWDYPSLKKQLSDFGFVNIKRFQRDQSADEMFLRPERLHQFGESEACYGLALECSKPHIDFFES